MCIEISLFKGRTFRFNGHLLLYSKTNTPEASRALADFHSAQTFEGNYPIIIHFYLQRKKALLPAQKISNNHTFTFFLTRLLGGYATQILPAC